MVDEWRRFSLTEDEALGFTVVDDAMGNAKTLGTHCLLGKLLMNKYYNRAAFKSTMLWLWGRGREVSVQDIGENLFLFQFKDEVDSKQVLQGSPWLFDHFLLVLNEFDGSIPAHHISFTRCGFWVQLHGIPLYYMTKQTGDSIGGSIGTVEEVDVPGSRVGWGPYLKVRLSIDVTKSIQRGRLVTFGSLGQMWIAFKYERLPWLCFHCGMLGHMERECGIRLRSGHAMAGDFKQYGPWLRAAEPIGCCRGVDRSRAIRPPAVQHTAGRNATNVGFKSSLPTFVAGGSYEVDSLARDSVQSGSATSSTRKLQLSGDKETASKEPMQPTNEISTQQYPEHQPELIMRGCFDKEGRLGDSVGLKSMDHVSSTGYVAGTSTVHEVIPGSNGFDPACTPLHSNSTSNVGPHPEIEVVQQPGSVIQKKC